MDTGDRIKFLRKKIRLTQREIAERLGIKPSAVTQWETGVTSPSGQNLIALAHLLKTTPDFILSGKLGTETLTSNFAYTLNDDGEDDEQPRYSLSYPTREHTTPTPITQKLPIISEVQAGHWREAVDNFMPGDADDWAITTSRVGSQAFALRVTGESMINPNGWPSIPNNSIVIVDPSTEPTNGSIVVAKLPDSNTATIKKLSIDGPNKYLKALNPEYRSIQIDEDCEIVGVVKQILQNL